MKRKWVSHLAFSNIKKHMKRNFFSVASLVIGLTSSFLIIGFSNNAKQSVINQSYRQFYYGNLRLRRTHCFVCLCTTQIRQIDTATPTTVLYFNKAFNITKLPFMAAFFCPQNAIAFKFLSRTRPPP